MIVGSGDIAKILTDRSGAIIFAAGVSNSQCIGESQYLRERKMIESFSLNKYSCCFFYFSSISIFYTTSRYTKHKEEMEELVRKLYHNHNIIRLGNITWGNNQNTFLNHILNKRNNNQSYVIRDEMKFMIDRKQLCDVVNGLPLNSGSNTISVFGEAMKVEKAIEKYLVLSECSNQYYLKNG